MQNKKKIGLVLVQAPVYSETFLTSKIQNLIDDGFDLTLFSNLNSKNNTNAVMCISYSDLSMAQLVRKAPTMLLKILKNIKVILKYKQLIKDQFSNKIELYKNIFSNIHILFNPVDHLHFEFSALAVQREYLAKAMGAKMTVSFRGYDVGISILKNNGSFDRIWETIDGVHTISDDLVKRALKHGLNPKTPVTKIHPAINTAKYLPHTNIDKLGTISFPLKLISIGRLHWKKGYDYTFSALKLLKDDGVDFSFTLIGEGEQKQELMYLAERLGLKNNIVFAGKKNHEEVLKLLREHHIYIQFSVQEGFCNSVLEAQCAGMLVITSDAEGLQENVLNDETGWIVKRRDYKALYAKIVDVIKLGDAPRNNIATHASERVKRDFDIAKQREQFRDFFNNYSY